MSIIEGKAGIITGAAGGIGRATAIMFAKAGARVACADIDGAGAAKVCREIATAGGRAIDSECDIVDRDSVAAMVERTVESFGRIDFLVSYADAWQVGNFDEVDEEGWDRIVDVNLKGTFYLCQAVAPVMIKQKYGRIVLMGTVAARIGSDVSVPQYVASKAGVAGLGRALAKRLGKHNITVNTLNPGLIETPLTANWPKESKDAMARMTPLGRIGLPDDVAGVAQCFVSDLCGWVTGATIEVNGGYYFG